MSAGGNFSEANIFVSCAIVKETPTTSSHHALDKYHIRNLADLFPFLFWRKDGFVRSPHELAGIISIEYRHGSAIDQMIVRRVVN